VRELAAFDDLHFRQDGKRVPADRTVVFEVDGAKWEIDLTDEHYRKMLQDLEPYMQAGEQTVVPPRPRVKHTTKTVKESRDFFAEVRQFAQRYGYPLTPLSKGGFYHPVITVAAYEEYKETGRAVRYQEFQEAWAEAHKRTGRPSVKQVSEPQEAGIA
jgi:Lsr2